MSSYKDWPIRYKLLLPLLAVLILGGSGIVSTFVGMYNEITRDALPEERALDGIRRASLELLIEYREFMIVQSDSTQREIDDLKEEIEKYEAVFAQSAGTERAESQFVAAIDAAEQKLKERGDEAVALRRQLVHQILALETFEGDLDNPPFTRPADSSTGNAPNVAADAETPESVERLELRDLLHEYLSEIREYVLAPRDKTLREIAEIELSLEQMAPAGGNDPAFEPEDQSESAAERMLIQRLLETGSRAVALTGGILTKLEALEESENELLDVLEKAGAVIAGETDAAFETGFAAVGTVFFAVLALILLVGFLVSQGIAGPVMVLANTAKQLGGGDLSARTEVGSQDEIGGLATAFNQMAESLESNVERRQRAENDLKALNDELEQRINDRTAELRAVQDELLRGERLATLGQLTATVSHELRNPLGTIRTSLFTVEERTRDKDLGVAQAIGRIERNIARCDKIIGELLDFSRMRGFERETTKFDHWLERILDEHALPEGIALHRELAAGITLGIDGERLRRVLVNILDNACHAIADGGGSRGIVTVSSRADERRLEVSVTDNGPGISADVRPRVFEPLFSTKSFGVGLGLPMVKQIMEQHGGGVEIENQEGGGARVVLWLALDDVKTGSQA